MIDQRFLLMYELLCELRVHLACRRVQESWRHPRRLEGFTHKGHFYVFDSYVLDTSGSEASRYRQQRTPPPLTRMPGTVF